MNYLQINKRNRKILIAIGASIAFVWFLAAAFQNYRLAWDRERTRQEQHNSKLSNEWIKSERERLAGGQTSQVYFYSTADTDSLVDQLSGMPEVKELTFELTDLSDDGVLAIVGLPNIECLTFYGGKLRVGNRGLGLLRGQKTLVTLKLVNTDVTDDGLAVLQTLPNLKNLTIYRDGFREKLLTDRAVIKLQNLSTLATLNVAGGWLSQSGLQSLREALPSCRVFEDANWDLSDEPI
jgi:hypothetical protein